jgi:hypothetical protein
MSIIPATWEIEIGSRPDWAKVNKTISKISQIEWHMPVI